MTDQPKAKFVERFGKLVDITERESAKGPYITFKMEGTNKAGEAFAIYGSCFKAEIIEQMKAAVGQQIWTKGPIDQLGEGKTSFKVIYFKLSTPKANTAEAAPAASQAPPWPA